MERKKARVLLVEDDRTLSALVRDILEINRYEVVICADGDMGLATFKTQNFDIILADIMMPRMDGITMVREIRRFDQRIPIIFITAKEMKEDKLEGFRAGADDYLVKPFSTEELIARMEAILRRVVQARDVLMTTSNEVFEFGSFTLNASEQMLIHKTKSIHITKKESDLLRLMIIKKNDLLLREVALKAIWGDDDYFIGRSMDVFISRLRKYLKADPNVEIVNVHGLGFKLVVRD